MNQYGQKVEIKKFDLQSYLQEAFKWQVVEEDDPGEWRAFYPKFVHLRTKIKGWYPLHANLATRTRAICVWKAAEELGLAFKRTEEKIIKGRNDLVI